MKLVIQIPCFNEAEWLPETLDALPRSLPGVDDIAIVVIDDGSTDATADVAKAHGADKVVRLPRNLGLAHAYMTGLRAAIALGADVIVNTDADNQYRAADIPRLLEPILAGRADLVIGTRPIESIEEFSGAKKLLQRVGSRAVSALSGIPVEDAASGFRAISRRMALQTNIFSEFTYSLETILQAGHKAIAVETVPIRVNPKRRPSRLASTSAGFVARAIASILGFFVSYRPLRFFMALGAVFFGVGFAIGIRFLVFYTSGAGAGKIQSLVLAAILMLMGFHLATLGVVAHLIGVNRKLLEDVQGHIREESARRAPE